MPVGDYYPYYNWCPCGCNMTLFPNVGRKEKKSPHRCPVCGGSGQIAYEFYHGWHDEGTTAKPPEYETCRSCGGTGVVWG